MGMAAVATPHFLSADLQGGDTHPTLSNKNPRKAGVVELLSAERSAKRIDQLVCSFADIAATAIEAETRSLTSLTPGSPNDVHRIAHRQRENGDGAATLAALIGLHQLLHSQTVGHVGVLSRKYGDGLR